MVFLKIVLQQSLLKTFLQRQNVTVHPLTSINDSDRINLSTFFKFSFQSTKNSQVESSFKNEIHKLRCSVYWIPLYDRSFCQLRRICQQKNSTLLLHQRFKKPLWLCNIFRSPYYCANGSMKRNCSKCATIPTCSEKYVKWNCQQVLRFFDPTSVKTTCFAVFSVFSRSEAV